MRIIQNSGFGDLGNPLLLLFANMFSGAQKAGSSSDAFLAAQQNMEAAELASQRSRRWATYGAITAGVLGLAGVVYLLRK